MNLTKTEYEDLIKTKGSYESKAQNLLVVFSKYNLTPSIDINQIKIEFKAQLFTKLLNLDKALKLQYEMHRVEAAKIALINNTISLDGYHEITEIEEAITAYLNAYRSFLYEQYIKPEDFLIKYAGSTENAFKGKVIDTTDTEIHKHLQAVVDILNSIPDQTGIIDEDYLVYGNFYNRLEKYLPFNRTTKKVEIDEEFLHSFINRND